MSFCYAKNCENNVEIESPDSPKIALYGCPKDIEILNIWKHNLSIDLNDSFEFSLCSLHFVDECFDPDDPTRQTLLPGAVPTLFTADPQEEAQLQQQLAQQQMQQEQMQDYQQDTMNQEQHHNAQQNQLHIDQMHNQQIQDIDDEASIGIEHMQQQQQMQRQHHMIQSQDPPEEVVHQHDLMQMVQNNTILQQNIQVDQNGQHVMTNGMQPEMNIILQQEVGEQEVVMEMSVPGSLMPTGQLDMSNGDVEPKTPEVLTVKQCRKPLAELLSIYNNKLHIIRLCRKNVGSKIPIKITNRKILTYSKKYKKNQALMELIKLPLCREPVSIDINSLQLDDSRDSILEKRASDNKVYHKKSYEDQQVILTDLQIKITGNSKLIGQLHYMESRQMDIIRLLRKSRITNAEIERLTCFQKPVHLMAPDSGQDRDDSDPLDGDAGLVDSCQPQLSDPQDLPSGVDYVKRINSHYNLNSVRYSIQELITSTCQNELNFKNQLEINCMISISVDNKDMMFVRMKRMLAEMQCPKRPEIPKHVMKKQSAIHKNRLENQIGGLVSELVRQSFTYRQQLVVNGVLIVVVDEAETLLLDLDRVVTRDHVTPVVRDSAYDAVDFHELMLRFNAMDQNNQLTYDIAKIASQAYLSNGTPLMLFQNKVNDDEDDDNEIEMKVGPNGEIATRYMCQYCGMVNDSRTLLANHIATVHTQLQNNNIPMIEKMGAFDNARKTKCPLCLLELAPNSMKLHLRMHTGEKPYKCDNCGLCFARVDYRARHSCKALSPALDRNKVTYCKCSSQQDQHFKLHHTCPHCNLFHDRCWCDICLAKFETRIEMKKHRLSHPSKFQCSICDARLTSKQSLKGHMARHNGTQSMYACDICGILMSELANLRRHMRVVHDGERRFQCDVCNKNFTSKMILIEHIRTHTGERPYQCESCERRFLAARDLKRHKCMSARNTFLEKNSQIVI